jgi:phosphoribosylcarboxyaminoimidazole (NCAIR) mutase
MNEQHPGQQMVVWPDICSADKTPEILYQILPEDMERRFERNVSDVIVHGEFDGVIGCGGKSLVLAYAAVKLLEKGSLGWTPSLFVPMRDSVTGGVSAYLSITDVPSAAEPRPAVHLDGVENAIEIMHSMMYARFDGVAIFHAAETAEDAKKVRDYLVKLGVRDQEILSREISAQNNFEGLKDGEASKVKIVVEVSDVASSIASPRDRSFMVYVGRKYTTDMGGHLRLLRTRYDEGNRYLSVGIGNYDAAAMLAARLLRRPEIEDAIDDYKAKNADENVREPRQKLIEEFKEGIR